MQEEEFAFSDEDGEWETKLVFQMLKDGTPWAHVHSCFFSGPEIDQPLPGEVFIRHETGKPGRQVHLQISPDLDSISWTPRGPRLRRQTSWSGIAGTFPL